MWLSTPETDPKKCKRLDKQHTEVYFSLIFFKLFLKLKDLQVQQMIQKWNLQKMYIRWALNLENEEGREM